MKTARFTIALVVLLLVAAIVTGPLRGPSPRVEDLVGIDLATLSHHQWWAIVTADFFVHNLAQLIAVLIFAMVGVGAAEYLMGTRRTIIAFLITGIAASTIGLGMLGLGVLTGEYWADAVRRLDTIDPLSPILGTIAAASAYASVLWRRRIRFGVVAFVIVFLLYSGNPADLYRLIAVLVGLLLGELLTRHHIHLERWTSSHHEARVLLATVTAVFALGPVITLISHGRFGLLAPLGRFMTDGSPSAGTAQAVCRDAARVVARSSACTAELTAHTVPGFSALLLALLPLAVLLVGAYGLLLGRRAANYVVALMAAANGILAAFYFGVIPAVGNPSHLAQRAGQSSEFGLWIVADAALPIAFAILVISQRRHFPITTAPRARRTFIATVGIAVLAAVGTYLVAGSLLVSQFRPRVGFMDLLADLPERFIPMAFLAAEKLDFVPASFAARLLFHGIGPLLWLVVLVALVAVLRRRGTSTADPDGAAAFRDLERVRGGSLSFPGTWAANSYWFDADHRMGIAYRIANGIAVTVGEPVGEPRDHRDSLGQFIRFCDENAWTPCFYSVHTEWAERLQQIGWSSVVVAEETVLSPAGWDLTGKKWQDVRSSINRAARGGVRVSWATWSELAPRITNQIAEISELWVVEKKLPELGFTLGGLDELKDADVLLGIAMDESGTVQAVTSWLPTWVDGVLVGRTLDFMRRRADGMNGVMEFLIAEAAVRAQVEGLEFLSLSGAPLAVTRTDAVPSPLERVLALLGTTLEPLYGFRSLLNFKQKFQPQLAPLYLAYSDAVALPAIAVALSRCYLPGLTLRESAALVRSLR